MKLCKLAKGGLVAGIDGGGEGVKKTTEKAESSTSGHLPRI